MSEGEPAAASARAADVEPDWQRLHPATLALAIVKLGPRSLNFLPALAAIGFAGKWAYVVPALLVFLLLSLLVAIAAWLRFRGPTPEPGGHASLTCHFRPNSSGGASASRGPALPSGSPVLGLGS